MEVALIAGGATGIGRATVAAFRAQDWAVLLADIAADAAAATIAETDALPGPARFHPCDLARPEAPAGAVAAAIAAFGALDCVFVNAAVLHAAPLADWTAEVWARSLAVNLTAPFLMVQAAAPHLARSANPSVILTASTGALRGHARMPAYHATKTGLLGLARALADELGPEGIRVNCLLPGWIDTPFNDPFWAAQPRPDEARARLSEGLPLRRQGLPGDVAGVVTFLASPAARYVTGTQIVVDGGYSAV
jgi:3-oxoacyl-[acyl-carrier protein] reductase